VIRTISYDQLAAAYSIPVTDVTNALCWRAANFAGSRSSGLRETCGTDEDSIVKRALFLARMQHEISFDKTVDRLRQDGQHIRTFPERAISY